MQTTEPGRSAYMFDNSSAEGGNQVRYLAQVLDQHSTSVLRRIGIGDGERWLDIGPGLGTITEFLLDEGAYVTAVDLDPTHLGRLEHHPRLEIIHGDIRTMDLSDRAFTGVHARLVFMHLPASDRTALLNGLPRCMAPSAPLVISDWWSPVGTGLVRRSPSPEATALLDRFQTTLGDIARAAGADLDWGQQTLAAMVEAGYLNVVTQYDGRTYDGGTGICLLHASNSRQKQDELLRAGMTVEQLDQLRRLLADPAVTLSSYLMCTTVGYTPSLTQPQPA